MAEIVNIPNRNADINGPATSTDNAIPKFDGIDGYNLQNTGVTIDDSNGVSGITQLNVDNLRLDGNTVSSTNSNGDVNLSPNGTGTVVINTDLDVDNINVNGNTISSTNANGNIDLDPNGTGQVVITGARLYGTALHNNAQAITGTTNQYIGSGTYTPTLVNGANVAASVAYSSQFMRVGNVVTVSGKVDIDPTAAAGTLTQLRISLPIASDFANAQECSGTAFTPDVAGQGAAIFADTTNNDATVSFATNDLSNKSMFYTFTYVIL